MSIKLTDTQLLMLSAAAQREDRCIAAPPRLKGAAAHKFAARLVAAGLVKEVKAKPGCPRLAARRCDRASLRAEVDCAAGLKTIASKKQKPSKLPRDFVNACRRSPEENQSS